MILERFQAGRENYREQVQEQCSFLARGTGGCSIANVADETELSRIMTEWPLTAYSKIRVCPLVDGDQALQFWAELFQSLHAPNENMPVNRYHQGATYATTIFHSYGATT